MRLGILGFSYATFPHFANELTQRGYYTVNLGDNAQTLAAGDLMRRCGIDAEAIHRVDRDTLSQYVGPEVLLLMNGAFRGPEFPLPRTIRPIFLGFSAGEKTLRQNVDFLRAHQPIGCRDTVTRDLLRALEIEAFVSGCVTLTFEPRSTEPEAGKIFVVSGHGPGRLPDGLVAALPRALEHSLEFISHRLPVSEYPLSDEGQNFAEVIERDLLDRFRREAALVVTPLHHVAAPCMALGIPVVLARAHPDPRFSYLESLVPIYYPDSFDRINWNPGPADISGARDLFVRSFLTALSAASA